MTSPCREETPEESYSSAPYMVAQDFLRVYSGVGTNQVYSSLDFFFFFLIVDIG